MEQEVLGSISVSQFFTNRMESKSDNCDIKISKNLQLIFEDFDDDGRREFFEVSETVDWIKKNRYQRVALQFPDNFLSNSYKISKFIEDHTEASTFILADTSYRSCCVDEVAAAHSSCDAIIHYGDACLSMLTETVPVKYVLGKLPVDLEVFDSLLRATFTDENDNFDMILLLTDAVYSYKIDDLAKSVINISHTKQLYIAYIVDPTTENLPNTKQVRSLGRLIPSNFSEQNSVKVLFVGDNSSPFLTIWLMSHPQCTTIINFDPQTGLMEKSVSQSWRHLRKRLFLAEKLSDANTVGLVIGSTSIKGHKEAVQRMRELCRVAAKKIYVISVGKINVPKLSNFSDIDVFVLLSCPFGVLLDTSEFYRPVLSMFEAEIALNPSKTWNADSGWITDFNEFKNDQIGEEDRDTDMSLITGRLRVVRMREESDEKNDGQLTIYTAGDYFKERSWHGLEDGVRFDDSTEVEEGRSGIAVGYGNERKI